MGDIIKLTQQTSLLGDNETGGYGCIRYITHSKPDLVLRKADYGKTWRCWACRPTNAEREAARWDE